MIDGRTAARVWWHALALLAVLAGSTPTLAGDITIRAASAMVENDIVMLDADADIVFSDDAIEALESGIRLEFELDLRISRPRRLMWDRELFSTRRRFSIERHALSNQFILTDMITGERRLHGSLDLAIEDLGHLRHVPVIGHEEIETDRPSAIALRLRLDLNALPAPMIPLAYVSPSWRMSSGWHRWQANL